MSEDRTSLDAIYEQLTEILREIFDDDTLVATPDLNAEHVAGWDSFANIRLILTIEKTFAVDFAAAQIAALQNVGQLAALIHSKLR